MELKLIFSVKFIAKEIVLFLLGMAIMLGILTFLDILRNHPFAWEDQRFTQCLLTVFFIRSLMLWGAHLTKKEQLQQLATRESKRSESN